MAVVLDAAVRDLAIVLSCLAATALWWLPAAAQDAVGQGEPGPPSWQEALPIPAAVQLEGGQKDLRLELVVHRWSDRGSQDAQGQRFIVSVAEQPAFMTNVRWEGGSELDFAPGEHSKAVTLVFDTAAAGATGEAEEDAWLVLRVEARHEAVIPPERKLEIPLRFTRALAPGEAVVSVCALRSDAPEDPPIEQAFEHCDPERVPVMRSDRVVVFFTPARDLREPIGEDQYFNWRILGPNGDRAAGGEFRNKGTVDAPEMTMAFAAEGSPGRFAVALELWNPSDDPDPARSRKGPGTYTVQTLDVRIEGSAVLGQGEATPYIDGEWRDEGSFEVGAVRLAFAGFVAEEVVDLPLPGGSYTGTLSVDPPQVSGTSVTIELRARWRTRPDKPEQRASSRLTLDFPAALDPEHEAVGSLEARLEVLEASDDSFPLLFTAGVHRLVTTTTAPPDRHLVEGDAIPALWETLQHNLGDCSGGRWVWTQWEGNPTSDPEPTEGSCAVRLELKGAGRDEVFGDPARKLQDHLHDPATLWVIPVFYRLTDDRHPWSSGQKLSLRSYGYAIYAAQPYTGPGPAGRPVGGERVGEPGVEGEVEPVMEDTETPIDAGTGTGTEIGTGEETGTTVVEPPAAEIDASDPGSLDPDRQPQVASLVREWLSVAEPPENAVPGVDFRYDELGRKIGGGGATGRVISSHATVDYGSGASSETRVWSALRTQLDSIDHCTLEEYVVARLEERSIEPCRGRYGAVRALDGVPLAAARAEVRAAGFEVALAPGSPAAALEEEGTIERQEPGASQYLKRGQTLTLVVHAPYVAPALAAPELVGLSRPEAKRRLEERGLVAALRPGSPARTAAESDTVEAQEPAAGARLERGAQVAIWVRSPFVATATIPNLVGLSTRDARAALAAAGIDVASIDLVPGGPAPNPALAGAVEAQEPAPGATVAPGRRVTLKVHSGFVDLRTVPPLVGLSVGDARQRLASLGLGVELAPGAPASAPGAEGTVQEQSPAGGSSVGAGAVVTLSIHGPYVAPPPMVPAPIGGTVTGEQPPLHCPQSLMRQAIPGINFCPNMWWTLVPGSGQVGSGRWGGSFSCSYHVPNAPPGQGGQLCAQPDRFIDVRWIAAGATDVDPRAHTDFCIEDSFYNAHAVNSERFRRGEEPIMTPSHWKLYSRTRKVRVELYHIGWDEQASLALAREMIGQAEPFAAPCAGAVIPAATPAPQATPTPWPQPAGSCFIQEYPGRGEVNLLFEQPAQGGLVILHLLSVPAGADAPISQQMTGIGARLVGSYQSYQEARGAADSICAGLTGGGGGPPPAPTPPPAPPACPGPYVTVVYELWNPPPYPGLGGVICRDGAGAMWINVNNNVHPVTAIQAGAQDPASGCWPGTGVVTPVHTYGGILCPK
jgi:beta-lactam-binding protein with PASTA domain